MNIAIQLNMLVCAYTYIAYESAILLNMLMCAYAYIAYEHMNIAIQLNMLMCAYTYIAYEYRYSIEYAYVCLYIHSI